MTLAEPVAPHWEVRPVKLFVIVAGPQLSAAVALASHAASAAQFGLRSYPSHAVIGPDGKLEAILTGGGPHRAEELKTIIARALNPVPERE